nr:hypothetical protein [Bacteroidales bacterium]
MMGEESNYITESIHIKNMVSHCCKFLLREKLEQANIQVLEVTLGKARISYDKDSVTHSDIENILTANGFGLLENKEDQLVSQIKLAVIE